MARSGVRNAIVITVFATIVGLLLRALRSTPLPTATTPAGGSAPSTTMAPATTDAAPRPASGEPTPLAEPLPGIGGADPLIAEGEPAAAATAGDGPPDWVEASAAEPAPTTHPVKAKLASGIYHLPGMLNYERTRPDRWYRSAEAAEADGLRIAKR